jgi:hypothetical protein
MAKPFHLGKKEFEADPLLATLKVGVSRFRGVLIQSREPP